MTEHPGETDTNGTTPRRALPRRKHLRRLDTIHPSIQTPLFFITVCTRRRRPCLADAPTAAVLVEELGSAQADHGWAVGRYVIMPDHVHFFCAPARDEAKSLSSFVGFWKRKTAARVRRSCLPGFAWQPEFFGHLLRSHESYAQKWEYVRANPVREGLVAEPDHWPFQGEISDLQW
jgi:REP element-mobilizing transposase RayT